MIPRTYNEFRKLLRRLSQSGQLDQIETALEIGALPDHRCVLACTELNDIQSKIGINLIEQGMVNGATVFKADARRLPFSDAEFDLLIAASTLEHIPDFWDALAEMRRVLAPGGLMVISTPGFVTTQLGNRIRTLAARLRLPDVLRRGSITMQPHGEPHDYYRFSKHTYRDVIFDSFQDVTVWSIMVPPRLYGYGRKKLKGASAGFGGCSA
jgi:SAM-dependent methyltransferase